MLNQTLKPASCITSLQLLCLVNDADSDKNIASKCRMTTFRFSKVKHGRYKPTKSERARLAKHFAVKPDFIDLLISKDALILPFKQFYTAQKGKGC